MNQSDLPDRPERREFLIKAAAVGVGATTVAVPLLAGLATLFDPLRRRTAAGGPSFVTTLDALPGDGAPRRFAIVADRSDAWSKYPNVPIGAVYLRRAEGGKVEAFNVTCPHAGCPIEYRAGVNLFVCPCHDSKFHLDGRLASIHSPSQRNMDSLEVEVRNGAEVWVKFQNFEAGKAAKIPLA
jgi:menaquinol-cytochrome c reductase iron-sulfur subunit